MLKDIFKNKYVYFLSIFFFLFGGTYFVPIHTQPFSKNYGFAHNFFVALMFIYSIVILVSLFNNKKNTVLLINIYIGIVLINNFKSFLYLILAGRFPYNSYIYKIDITIFLVIFLFLVNRYKANHDIKY